MKVGVSRILEVCHSKVSKKTSNGQATHSILQDFPPSDETPPASPRQPYNNVYDFFSVRGKTNPIALTIHVNMAVLPMELDTGASLSLISEDLYKSIILCSS